MTALDTDALLVVPLNLPNKNKLERKVELWKRVVEANTKAFQKIRADLDKCDNADKVRAIIADVEKALQDLSVTSQKVDVALADLGDSADLGDGSQYPVGSPLNPANPVPWPPGYTPPVTQEAYQMQTQGHAPTKEEKKDDSSTRSERSGRSERTSGDTEHTTSGRSGR